MRNETGGAAQREVKTIVFTDIVGSTKLKQDFGDVIAMQAITNHHSLVRSLLSQFPGGREIKSLGDGFLLTFEIPSDAVCFALRLQNSLRKKGKLNPYGIKDRIGIHVGEVFKQGTPGGLDDIGGIHVDKTARVSALAEPGHILITRFAYDNAHQVLQNGPVNDLGKVHWGCHGLHQLKGIEDLVEIYEVAELNISFQKSPALAPASPQIKTWLGFRELKRTVQNAIITKKWGCFAWTAFSLLVALSLLSSSLLTQISFNLNHLVFLNADERIYTNDVAFVVMDNKSMVSLGQTNLADWDRGLHSQLITNLQTAHAKAIVFDIVFTNHQSSRDPAFVKTIRNYGKVAIAAAYEVDVVPGVSYVISHIYPIDELKTNAWLGLTESASIKDMAVYRPAYSDEKKKIAQSPLKSLAEVVSENLRELPKRSPGAAWLRYYCPPGPSQVTMYPYYQVVTNDFKSLSNSIIAAVFSNKVVFVGSRLLNNNAGAPGTDFFHTPYSLLGFDPAPGVLVNATSYLNLRRGDWFEEAPFYVRFFIITTLVLVAGFVFPFIPPFQAFVFGLVISLSLIGVEIFLFRYYGVWFEWLTPCCIQVPLAVLGPVLIQTRQRYFYAKTTTDSTSRTSSGLTPDDSAKSSKYYQPASGSIQVTPVEQLAKNEKEPLDPWTIEVPDHQLIKRIGAGAYGQVWLAHDIIGTYHAVKILQKSRFHEERPYEREFNGIRRFTPISRQHPGLVQILHVGRNEKAGFMYYIMEAGDDELSGQKIDPDNYVPRNLSRDLAKQGPMGVKALIEISMMLADALQFLHDRSLIHRDIKPSNIIYVNGHPKLADIGLVTEMAGNKDEITLIGTAGYVAPEGPGTAAADVYSLGKLMYVACSGCPVQDFPDLPTSLAKRSDADRILELNQIILKACEPVACRRYQSAKPLLDDLRKLKNGLFP